jgi:hypothetical protein
MQKTGKSKPHTAHERGLEDSFGKSQPCGLCQIVTKWMAWSSNISELLESNPKPLEKSYNCPTSVIEVQAGASALGSALGDPIPRISACFLFV